MFHRAAVFVVVLLSTSTTPLGAVEKSDEGARAETRAEWIWAPVVRRPKQIVVFRTSFDVPSPVPFARLHALADFCDAEVFLNGRLLFRSAPYDAPLNLDVRQWFQVGVNELAMRCKSVEGPAAVFAHLEYENESGERLSVVSDASWRCRLVDAADSLAGEGWLEQSREVATWDRPRLFGRVAAEAWLAWDDNARIDRFDDYTQWKQALDSKQGTDPASFQLPPGFRADLIRSAGDDEGSWVSMAFDPRGRVVLAREDQGLLRLTLGPDAAKDPLETINDSLKECRGLLFAHGNLYANANNSKVLCRLRDTDGDDLPDAIDELYKSTGGVGHGRNDLTLGPDGKIYSIHGDSVDLPEGAADRTSPFREQRRGAKTREGHVIRMSPDGSEVEVVAAGLRNPFGIAFNRQGEMFTYDADAEFDMGAPWYRPTRVNQLVSGGDFGWRGVTGQWPPYYPDHPDNALATLDVGKGSPTAVAFGESSHFPPPFRNALFILDWAYGRILAVHMTGRGAGYSGRAVTFVRGQPLNVTDLAFGPDGGMYFITGGRRTQSALYRVRYVGRRPRLAAPTEQQQARAAFATKARRIRRRLEQHHGSTTPEALDVIWPYLGDAEPRIRYAARIAVEHRDVDHWLDRAVSEEQHLAGLTALLALARSKNAEAKSRVLDRLLELPWETLSHGERQIAFHILFLCQNETPIVDAQAARWDAVDSRLLALYPADTYAANQALSQLLVKRKPAEVVKPTMDLLMNASSQSQRMHYLFVLRHVKRGWTPLLRRAYFQRLAEAKRYLGGQGMSGFLERIRNESRASLSDDERQTYAHLLDAADSTPSQDPPPKRPLVQQWKVDELINALSDPPDRPNFELGQRVFREALCSRCHRLGAEGTLVGPDLTSVSRRFNRRDLLLSIVEPSRVVAENYRQVQVATTEGKVLTGRIVPGGDYRSPELTIVPDLLRPGVTQSVPKSSIESYRESPLSPMPKGLLDTFAPDEVWQLLAYMEAGGNREHPLYSKKDASQP